MKRILFLFLLLGFWGACSNSSSKRTDAQISHEEVVETSETIPLSEKIEDLELPLPLECSETILKRLGYTVSYNKENNLPNWVAWELTPERLVENCSRCKHYYPDPDFPRSEAVETGDYANSGYDRGHMCPAHDNKWNEQAMRESFYLTNFCPQNGNLNRGDWKELEEKCRKWVEESCGSVYIACGPILYQKVDAKYIGREHQIRVPEAFFKVVLKDVEKGEPKAIGFIYKNTAGNHPLDAYVNSVDEVERITGMDFFSALPDEIEEKVESAFDIQYWD